MTTLAQDAIDEPGLPFRLRDNDASGTDDVDATNLPVIGALPIELGSQGSWIPHAE